MEWSVEKMGGPNFIIIWIIETRGQCVYDEEKTVESKTKRN